MLRIKNIKTNKTSTLLICLLVDWTWKNFCVRRYFKKRQKKKKQGKYQWTVRELHTHKITCACNNTKRRRRGREKSLEQYLRIFLLLLDTKPQIQKAQKTPKVWQHKILARVWRKSNSHSLLVGMQNTTAMCKIFWQFLTKLRASLVAQSVKNLPAMQTFVQFLGWVDPLEKEMATQSSTLGQRSLAGYSPQGHKSWTQLSN